MANRANERPGGYVSPQLPVDQREQLERAAKLLWDQGFRLVVTTRNDPEWNAHRNTLAVHGRCRVCERPLPRGGRKYCSSSCYQLGRVGIPVPKPTRVPVAARTRRCLTCKKHFTVEKQGMSKNYCSLECYWDRYEKR